MVLVYFEAGIPPHELKNDEYWSTEEFQTLKSNAHARVFRHRALSRVLYAEVFLAGAVHVM